MSKKLLLPGQIFHESVVRCAVPMLEGGSLKGEIKYLVETDYLDGKWGIDLEWVDQHGQGHKEHLPSPVVVAITRHTDATRAVLRKRRAATAAETRKSKKLLSRLQDENREEVEG